MDKREEKSLSKLVRKEEKNRGKERRMERKEVIRMKKSKPPGREDEVIKEGGEKKEGMTDETRLISGLIS